MCVESVGSQAEYIVLRLDLKENSWMIFGGHRVFGIGLHTGQSVFRNGPHCTWHIC